MTGYVCYCGMCAHGNGMVCVICVPCMCCCKCVFFKCKLCVLIEKQKDKLVQLSPEQEQELVDDVKLFLVAACVRDGWSFDEIRKFLKIQILISYSVS